MQLVIIETTIKQYGTDAETDEEGLAAVKSGQAQVIPGSLAVTHRVMIRQQDLKESKPQQVTGGVSRPVLPVAP